MHFLAKSVLLLLLVHLAVAQTESDDDDDKGAKGKDPNYIPPTSVPQPYCDRKCKKAYHDQFVMLKPIAPFFRKCCVNIGACHEYRCGRKNCPDCRKRCLPVKKTIKRFFCGAGYFRRVTVVVGCKCRIPKIKDVTLNAATAAEAAPAAPAAAAAPAAPAAAAAPAAPAAAEAPTK